MQYPDRRRERDMRTTRGREDSVVRIGGHRACKTRFGCKERIDDVKYAVRIDFLTWPYRMFGTAPRRRCWRMDGVDNIVSIFFQNMKKHIHMGKTVCARLEKHIHIHIYTFLRLLRIIELSKLPGEWSRQKRPPFCPSPPLPPRLGGLERVPQLPINGPTEGLTNQPPDLPTLSYRCGLTCHHDERNKNDYNNENGKNSNNVDMAAAAVISPIMNAAKAWTHIQDPTSEVVVKKALVEHW